MLVLSGNKNKYPTPYFSEWGPKAISTLNLKKTAQGEWHGPCPNCGGVDRFWIKEFHGEMKINCRQCNDFAEIARIMREQGIYPKVEKESRELEVVNFPQQESKHPYLDRKRIKQHNAEIDGTDLVIPIINKSGKLVGKQFIEEDGKKKFSFQMPVTGNFCVLNGPINDFAWVCEGFATAATLTELTGKPAIHALNAGNISAVCGAIKEAKPNAKLMIAGDNDDAGRKACEKAFLEHGVEHILPPDEGIDWNDLYIAKGPEFTRRELQPRNILDQVVFPWDVQPQLAANYLVKNWLTEGTMSAVYGASNVGKSFFVLDMAYHIAANTEWCSNKVKGGSVLYLATEGGNQFQNRVVALRDKYTELTDVKLAVRPSPINLYDADEDIAKIKALISEISKKHGAVKMLVVDTLSRATQGQMDENSNSEAARLISQLDLIRENSGVHILLVAHSGKDSTKGLRGASSIRAALDTEIELTYDEETRIRTARSTKQRDMETGHEFNFILDTVTLGEDEDGDPVTTCVVRMASDSEIEEIKKPKPKGKNQKLFKQVFTQLRGENVGGPNPAGAGFPEARKFWCIDAETIKDHFCGKLVGVARPAQAFKQTVDSMQAADIICVNDGKIWFTGSDGKVFGSYE